MGDSILKFCTINRQIVDKDWIEKIKEIIEKQFRFKKILFSCWLTTFLVKNEMSTFKYEI
jgi:hypothetical protein